MFACGHQHEDVLRSPDRVQLTKFTRAVCVEQGEGTNTKHSWHALMRIMHMPFMSHQAVVMMTHNST